MADSGSSQYSFKRILNEYDITFQFLYPLRLEKKYMCVWIIIRNESVVLLPRAYPVSIDITSSLPTAYLFTCN